MGRPRKPPAEKAKTLPARYRQDQRIASWRLDWTSEIGIRVMSELLVLANDLGGWENLSRQRQILVERAVHHIIKLAEFETADFEGKPLPFDHGVASNKANVLSGLLTKLGLDHVAKEIRSPSELMNRYRTMEQRP